MPILEVEHISKSFNKTPVLKDVGFNLEKGQAVSIIGSSGSGKTTLLRCLNFLEHPDNGIIRVNGETLFDASIPATTQESVIRKKRLHFGLVFQNFNLFPQYTALENVMLAKKLLAAEQPDFKERKREILTAIEVQAKVLLTQMGLDNQGWTIIRISFPADNASELLLQGHLPCNRTSSVLMSRLLHWIRN